jgi:hypothetical protein
MLSRKYAFSVGTESTGGNHESVWHNIYECESIASSRYILRIKITPEAHLKMNAIFLFFIRLWDRSADIAIVDVPSPLTQSYDISVMVSSSVLVKVLYYKPEGRGFETRWGEILNLANTSDRTRPWGLLSL